MTALVLLIGEENFPEPNIRFIRLRNSRFLSRMFDATLFIFKGLIYQVLKVYGAQELSLPCKSS